MDLILITDGEVWEQSSVLSSAERSGHRIFTVGVGSAVSEALLQSLAAKTNGACELVSPSENMAEHIVRHYLRINQPIATSIDIQWPSPTLRESPAKFSTVYAGDTIHVFAWFNQPPVGNVKIILNLDDGQIITRESALITAHNHTNKQFAQSIPRLGAYSLLESMSPNEIASLAEKYQLITNHTSCVLVHARDGSEKSLRIPAVVKVPQVAAAGANGFGRIRYKMARPSLDMDLNLNLNLNCDDDIPFGDGLPSSPCDEKLHEELTIESELSLYRITEKRRYSSLIETLNERYPSNVSTQLDIKSIAELKALGLEKSSVDFLNSLIDFAEEEQIVSDFLWFLAVCSFSHYKEQFSKQARRTIDRANSQIKKRDDQMGECISNYLALGLN